MNTKNITTRRKILKNSILGSAAFSYPNLLAANKSDNSKIIGDGEYQYEELGIPFLGALGRTIYEYERKNSLINNK